MQINISGKPAFGYAEIELAPGESIITESGAMATMSSSIDLKASLNGGLLRGLMRKFFGNESLFINTFTNRGQEPARMTITQPTPGDILIREMNNDVIFLQPSAFIACEHDVKWSLKFAGLVSFISREGLFKIKVTGKGKLLFGAYGHILERNVIGETIVDTGHLVAYDPQMKLKLQLSGGLISSLTSGEGLVTRMEGNGRIWIQSRSLGGLAKFINRFF